jgi:hypothetical protein
MAVSTASNELHGSMSRSPFQVCRSPLQQTSAVTIRNAGRLQLLLQQLLQLRRSFRSPLLRDVLDQRNVHAILTRTCSPIRKERLEALFSLPQVPQSRTMSSEALVSDTFLLSGEHLNRLRQALKVAGHQARVARSGQSCRPRQISLCSSPMNSRPSRCRGRYL